MSSARGGAGSARRRHTEDRKRPTRAEVQAFRAVSERMQDDRAAARQRAAHDGAAADRPLQV